MRVAVGKMKKLLACLIAAMSLLTPSGASSESSTEVPPVQEVFATEEGAVFWNPPQLPPAQLAQVTYRLFGILDGSEVALNATVVGTSAVVPSGYTSYGVQVVLGLQVSIVVYSCLFVDPDTATVQNECVL